MILYRNISIKLGLCGFSYRSCTGFWYKIWYISIFYRNISIELGLYGYSYRSIFGPLVTMLYQNVCFDRYILIELSKYNDWFGYSQERSIYFDRIIEIYWSIWECLKHLIYYNILSKYIDRFGYWVPFIDRAQDFRYFIELYRIIDIVR